MYVIEYSALGVDCFGDIDNYYYCADPCVPAWHAAFPLLSLVVTGY